MYIDTLLRNIWLECCGHLSAFTIQGQSYAVSPDKEFDDKSMNISLGKVLAPGMKFTYEYDFGTTTELVGKVIEEYSGKENDHVIIARNEPPLMICGLCQQPAETICTECGWESKTGLLCKDHSKQHAHDEEMYLPVVNSPRVGECAYAG